MYRPSESNLCKQYIYDLFCNFTNYQAQRYCVEDILIFRGKGGRETLKQGLERRNTVEYVEAYQRVVCDATPCCTHSKKPTLLMR
jgi:hypothetical protein